VRAYVFYEHQLNFSVKNSAMLRLLREDQSYNNVHHTIAN